MLTTEKVLSTFRLLDVVIYMFEHSVGANMIEQFGTKMEAMHGRYTINERFSHAFYTILRDMDNDWFIISVHPESETGTIRRANSYINKTPLQERTCTYCYAADNLGLTTYGGQETLEVLKSITCVESDLFQLQTMHDDFIAFCLLIEAYLRNKIQDYYYMPINVDKLLNMDIERMDSVSDFWSNYIEAFEEIGCD